MRRPKWTELSDEMKEAYRYRAYLLNEQPIPGTITSENIHEALDVNEKNVVSEISSLLCQDLQQNAKLFHHRLITGRRNGKDSNASYKFYQERIRVGSQIYRTFRLPCAIIRCIFGKDMSRIQEDEIIKETNKQCYIHIASLRRLSDLFTIQGLNLVGTETNNHTFHYGGTILIKMKNETRTNIFYIIDETNTSIIVCTRSNEEMHLYKPKYDRTIKPISYGKYDESSCYQFENHIHSEYEVIEYYPVRMIVSIKAITNLTFLSNRVVRLRNNCRSIADGLC